LYLPRNKSGTDSGVGEELRGATGQGALISAFRNNFVRYMAFEPDPGPSYDLLKFDFDADPARLKTMAEIYNSTNLECGAPHSRFNAESILMLSLLFGTPF